MTTVNVLRYFALGSGLVYGFVHDKNLKSQGKREIEEQKAAHKQKLIDEAKKEWQLQHQVKIDKAGKIDWESKDLDWGKAIEDTLKTLESAKA